MERTSFVNRESLVGTMWVAFSALGLGVLLGGAWALAGQRIVEPPLLHTAFQSAFSAAVLGVLASARSQELSLDVESSLYPGRD